MPNLRRFRMKTANPEGSIGVELRYNLYNGNSNRSAVQEP